MQGALAGQIVPRNQQVDFPQAAIYQVPRADVAARRDAERQRQAEIMAQVSRVGENLSPPAESITPPPPSVEFPAKHVVDKSPGPRKTLELFDKGTRAKIRFSVIGVGRGELAWQVVLPTSGDFVYIPPLGAKFLVSFDFPDGPACVELIFLGALAEIPDTGFMVMTLHRTSDTMGP